MTGKTNVDGNIDLENSACFTQDNLAAQLSCIDLNVQKKTWLAEQAGHIPKETLIKILIGLIGYIPADREHIVKSIFGDHPVSDMTASCRQHIDRTQSDYPDSIAQKYDTQVKGTGKLVVIRWTSSTSQWSILDGAQHNTSQQEVEHKTRDKESELSADVYEVCCEASSKKPFKAFIMPSYGSTARYARSWQLSMLRNVTTGLYWIQTCMSTGVLRDRFRMEVCASPEAAVAKFRAQFYELSSGRVWADECALASDGFLEVYSRSDIDVKPWAAHNTATTQECQP